MSSTIKENLKTFLNLFLSHPVCASNVLLLALTIGFEQVWENVAFKCPNETSTVQLYSILFVVAPALGLWMLGILGSSMARRLCQGMKYRAKPHDCIYFKPCCWHLIVISLRAFLIPLVWGFVALMDGDFYACFFYLPKCPDDSSSDFINGVNCTDDSSSDFINGVNCTDDIAVWTLGHEVESQMIGWAYLAVCLFLAIIVVFCSRCYNRRTYFLHLYSNKLKKSERIEMEKQLQGQAEKDAKRNVGAFMLKFSTLPAKDWDAICKECTSQEYEKPEPRTDPDKKETVMYHSRLSEFLSVTEEQQKALLQPVAQPEGPQNLLIQSKNLETKTLKPETETLKPETHNPKI